MDRLDDIYSCIKSSAETFANQMVDWPKLSNRGIVETEILMAAVLADNIEKNIILQSLLNGNPYYSKLNITEILLAIDSYLNLYKANILFSDVVQRIPLLEFAKNNGKLQIGNFIDKKTGEEFKAGIFTQNDSTRLFCSMEDFNINEQTANFISQNKNEIYVDELKNGRYKFSIKHKISERKESFLKQIAWYIYVSPLNYKHSLNKDEIEDGLKQIKKVKSNVIIVSDINNVTEEDFNDTVDICPYIDYALYEGLRFMKGVAKSIGII